MKARPVRCPTCGAQLGQHGLAVGSPGFNQEQDLALQLGARVARRLMAGTRALRVLPGAGAPCRRGARGTSLASGEKNG
jgi:hypothetical protein